MLWDLLDWIEHPIPSSGPLPGLPRARSRVSWGQKDSKRFLEIMG